jgi:autotransporter passenger strand-loop-strand repeat protein/T5SS/PEP-CTERM-associated repeat protein
MTIYFISSGNTSPAAPLNNGDDEYVLSGGTATSATVNSGGLQIVYSGGVAISTMVSNGGTQVVSSGGSANDTITRDGFEIVSSGGVATGTVVIGGGDSMIVSGRSLFVGLVLAGGAASGTVLSGGYETVLSGGVAVNTIVSSDGADIISSGGMASFTTVTGGGNEYIVSGGTATSDVVDEGNETVEFGGTVVSAIVMSGASEGVYDGAVASDTTLIGGDGYVYTGGVVCSLVVSSGGEEFIGFVIQGGVASVTVVSSGGELNVSADGLAVDTDVGLGGELELLSSGTASSTSVESGGSEFVYSGGTASFTTVSSGGTEFLSSGGTAFMSTVSSGGTEVVSPGGMVSGTLVRYGGSIDLPGLVFGSGGSAVLNTQTDVLTVIESGTSATLQLSGEYEGQVFQPIQDSGGGTLLTLVDGPRTLVWTGTTDPSFANLANWDDLTNTLNPAQAAPNATDEAEFLSGGGTIAGTGTAAALVFGGPADWLLGSSSTLTAAGTAGVTVGEGGSGLLSLSNGATLISQGATDIVSGTSRAADVTVVGPGSDWTSDGELVVGDAGEGFLSIQANGTVTAGGGLIIANTTSASGSSVDVSDADLSVTGTLVVGASGYASLSLSQGASVTVGSLDLASASTGDGVVSVVGSGTTLDVTGSLTIGDQSTGEMSILDGASVSIGGGLVGGVSGSSGNLDVEGAGSTLTINTGTLVVGENGPAEYTLGQGTTQQGAERTAAFGIANLGGLQDPPYLTNDGGDNLIGGYQGEADIAVLNSGTYTVRPLNGTFAPPTIYTPDITFDPGSGAEGSTTGVWEILGSGTLVLNATTVDASQTIVFASASAAELVIGQVPSTVPGSHDTDGAAVVTGSIAAGAANVLPGFMAPIENYQSGDVIALRGLTYGSATASGDVVTVWSGGAGTGGVGTGTVLGTLTFLDRGGNATGVTAAAEAAAAARQISALACFVGGTRIGTPDGAVAVEALRVGDLVVTGDGRRERVVWVGSRTVDCARHPEPEAVWPVRVRAGAFGVGSPARDLWLSPDHAVFVEEVLVPVRLLVNGGSIRQVERSRVVYHHVELRHHEVILAEGLTVESYLDVGDRGNFSEHDTVRLFPDFGGRLAPDAARVWETRGAAPLVLAGERLARAREFIAATTTQVQTARPRSVVLDEPCRRSGT